MQVQNNKEEVPFAHYEEKFASLDPQEVAKRCGASLSEVERINKVTGDSLCDGSPLIVK